MTFPNSQTGAFHAPLPTWVPQPVRHYIDHIGTGRSLRDIARDEGCHASTVMRQVRRLELMRDDPLVDTGLARLERLARPDGSDPDDDQAPDETKLQRDVQRVLRALMEPDTVLVVSIQLEDAVVLRDGAEGPHRRAVLTRHVAEMLALKGLIEGGQAGRVARYRITAKGRAELARLMAASETQRAVQTGFAEAPSVFRHCTSDPAPVVPSRPVLGPSRPAGAEPPLQALARRRVGGAPFLEPGLLRAGERFREEYEIAHMPADPARPDRQVARREAAARIAAATRALGPDLSEVLVLCCCQQQGMEVIEREMAFSARSGKIVLRIALRSLKRHYDATPEARVAG